MEDLLAEIDRKHKSIQSNSITSNKKYFKKGDLLKAEREALIQKKEKIQEERLRWNTRKEDQLNQKAAKCDKDADKKQDFNRILPREEVIKRLRTKNLPIRLFGETDLESCDRLRLAEITDRDETKGTTNEFQHVLEKMDQTFLNEQYAVNDKFNNPKDFKVVDDSVTIESIKESAKFFGKNEDVSKDCDTILSFFQLMLSIWARDLNRRSIEEKLTLSGKMEGARYEQTFNYIKPLFKKLRSRTLAADILKFLSHIVHYCVERDYVKANDAYLQMAIGNAPWPIGVTMVCIHARTGREKIATQHVAHVLNDETQRKYIQAIKRLMTYSQRTYPAEPSKSIEYGALDGRFT